MANVAVIGAQWGDEGKGKVVDWLASRADVVVRFQGGHNAGHTLVVGNETYKLALLPSGLVRGKLCLIGNGVVIDPEALLAEIARVQAQGLIVSPETLRVAENATLILPFHPALDKARELARGDAKIGTTGRGIGPAYEDRVARRAIRVADLAEPETMALKLDELLRHYNTLLRELGAETFEKQAMLAHLLALAPKILPYAEPVWERMDTLRKTGKRILFEGAQAVMLDVDHGTYPFVTSSNTVALAPRPDRGSGHGRWGSCWGSPRLTPPGWGRGRSRANCSTRPGSYWGTGERVRHQYRTAAALRLVRRGDGAAGGEDRRHPGDRADQAGRAGWAAGTADLHGVPDQG